MELILSLIAIFISIVAIFKSNEANKIARELNELKSQSLSQGLINNITEEAKAYFKKGECKNFLSQKYNQYVNESKLLTHDDFENIWDNVNIFKHNQKSKKSFKEILYEIHNR